MKKSKKCLSMILATALSATPFFTNSSNAQDLEQKVNQESQEDIVKKRENRIRNYIATALRAVDGQYDITKNWYNGSLEELMKEIFLIRSVFTYDVCELGKNGRQFEVTSEESIGSGVLINNDDKMTLATCNHVIEPEIPFDKIENLTNQPCTIILKSAEYRIPLFEYDVTMSLPFTEPITKRLVFEIPFEIIGADQNNDVAIISELPGGRQFTKEFRPTRTWGNIDELKPGHFVYEIGHPYVFAKIVTEGYIASMGDPWIDYDDHKFWIDTTTNPGNSGGAVYALRDGQPELIGLTATKSPDSGLGGIIKIDKVRNLLDKIGKSEFYKKK